MIGRLGWNLDPSLLCLRLSCFGMATSLGWAVRESLVNCSSFPYILITYLRLFLFNVFLRNLTTGFQFGKWVIFLFTFFFFFFFFF